jgi:translation initiation factor IF-1
LVNPRGSFMLLRIKIFLKVDTMLNTALFNVLCDNIVETYMSLDNGKDIRGVLKDKFRVSNADNELYVME